jgi:hypothetical protein
MAAASTATLLEANLTCTWYSPASFSDLLTVTASFSDLLTVRFCIVVIRILQDYSIHPLSGKERRLNLIVYLTPDWDRAWFDACILSFQHAALSTLSECMQGRRFAAMGG